jgi:hypothetical protein
MSTARCRSALLCICISLSGFQAPAAEPSARSSAAELELGLASRPQLYLVLDAVEPSLEIRARGMALDRIEVRAAAVCSVQPLLGRHRCPELETPLVWRVSGAPAIGWRRIVAPSELRRYTDEAAADAQPVPAEPAQAVPEAYHADLDSGWQLVISTGPTGGVWRRLADGVGDSLRAWTGRR